MSSEQYARMGQVTQQ